MGVNRETKVEQSVQEYAKARLLAKDWDAARLEVLDEFPFEQFEGDLLRKNYLAFGFNFDDQGRAAEMGSDFKTRVYTLEFFVFGKDNRNAKAIANDLKFAIDTDEIIPLLDIGEPGMPQIDSLVVVGVNAQKVIVNDPEPYQENVWLTTARVQDDYYASAA